jgi:nucleoside phosphorylase
MVPTEVEIMGYSVQLLKVRSLTVAVAAHRYESKLVAIKAVSEIADGLNSAMSN